EGARLVENSLQKILLCGHQTFFPRIIGDLVPLLEGSTIQCKLLKDSGALGAIPAIGQQNTTNVPKKSADLRHVCLSFGCSTLRAAEAQISQSRPGLPGGRCWD